MHKLIPGPIQAFAIFAAMIFCGTAAAQAEKPEPLSVEIRITSDSGGVKVNVIEDHDAKEPAAQKAAEAGKPALALPIGAKRAELPGFWESFKNWIHGYIAFEGFAWWDVLYLFVGLTITIIVGRTVQWFFEKKASRFTLRGDSRINEIFFTAIGRPAFLLIFSLGLFISSWPLTDMMSPLLRNFFDRMCLAIGAVAFAWSIFRCTDIVEHLLVKLMFGSSEGVDALMVGVIKKALKLTIIIVSVLFIGQNILDLNITTLLAGAGVMGLAVAFAAQDTIANFFGSIMIIIDQPFNVGDIISVSSYKGCVENVGFRSTQIRTFDGHLVSLPNKALANADIENISRRQFIRQMINLGVTYDTGHTKMTRAVELLHKLLDNQPCMDPERPPRIVFDKFNDYSLNISITVWWHLRDEKNRATTPDYGIFVKWLHDTDMEILRMFDSEGIEFAFPTSTTYLASDDKRGLRVLSTADGTAPRN